MTHARALTARALEKRLAVYLDPALSSRRTAVQLARDLAACTRAQQDFVLHWGAVVARDNAELAYQFTAHVRAAIRLMDLDGVEAWLLHAMDLYDRSGQRLAMRAFQDPVAFASNLRETQAGAVLDDHAAVLERFVRGLNGRPLAVAAAERCCTDTETIFLPPLLARLPDEAANVRLYKAMAVHQWAQNWYGTWRGGRLLAAAETGALGANELPLVHALETIRLDARLAGDYPGLHRDMAALRRALEDDDAGLRRRAAALAAPTATVDDTLRLAAELRGTPPGTCCYRGELDPAAVRERLDIRKSLDRERLRGALVRLMDEGDDGERTGAESAEPGRRDTTLRARPQARRRHDPDGPDGIGFELLLDGNPVAPPADVLSTMASIVQDLGEIPPDYLAAAGPDPRTHGSSGVAEGPDAVRTEAEHAEDAFLYDEWDFGRRHHRQAWCALRERALPAGDLVFYRRTLDKYGGLIKSIRRAFEVLRGEDRTLRRQPIGEDIDIDALVEAHADAHAGREMTQRVFLRQHKDERSMAVMLMVDMSGSTKGWINQAEREALVLLSEALTVLGDRFAIYGFSGWTRKRCEVFPVKRFAEPYGDAVKSCIGAIAPKDYTRMGAPIRHLSRLLQQQPARTKLLITLSDGKPDDYDLQYRGDYGIEDTRSALLEARRAGIHPFCITIDEQGADYLPHMFGAARYVVVADVARLPVKVSEIYRRIAL
jgi:nitric oxide reductase NorD protein